MVKPLASLANLPRKALSQGVTPLEACPRLAKALGAGMIWVKRDDCNGLAFGGNKVRQMEYYLGEALSMGCDTLLITGAVQSNFVRTAAAACAKNGLACHVQLEARVSKSTDAYSKSGNVLLDHMLGAIIHTYPVGEDEAGADRNLEKIADRLRADGAKPYVVHLAPGHPPLGALGYVDCALELDQQLKEGDIFPDCVFVPTGSGSTHAGFVYGWRALGRGEPVIGSCVRRSRDLQMPRIVSRLKEIAELLQEVACAAEKDVHITDAFLAPGYGSAGDEVRSAIALAASCEALILDPVYTGKTFAAAFQYVRQHPGCEIVILHTGGGPSIFGYDKADLLP